MRATKIEIRTRALRAGRFVNGAWEPAGQLVATLWLEEPDAHVAREIAEQIRRIRGEDVVASTEGREDVPTE